MSKMPNIELIEEKFKNAHKRMDDADKAIVDLEKTVKAEYTPLTKTNEIEKRVGKFENLWDWALKILLTTIIVGLLALLGLGAK